MRIDGVNKIVFSDELLKTQKAQNVAQSSQKTQEDAASLGVQPGKDAAVTTLSADKANADDLKTQMEGEIRSTSADGDQLRVKDAVVQKSEDGVVRQKEQVSDLRGYTQSQVDAMYYQGRVSKNDYDQYMSKAEDLKEQMGIGNEALAKQEQEKRAEAREEKLEEAKEERIAQLTEEDTKSQLAENREAEKGAVNKVTVNRQEETETQNKSRQSLREASAVETKADAREQERVQSNAQAEDTRAKQQENDRAFVEQMNAISARQTNNDIENDALMKAVDGKRVEIMSTILGIDQ